MKIDPSDNTSPFDTYMKHAGYEAPLPLSQLVQNYVGVRGIIKNARWVQTEIKNFLDFKTDLVLELEIEIAPRIIVKHYLHIEFQRTNVSNYKYTMLIYRSLLMAKYETENISSVVIYCGDSPCTMDFSFTNAELPFVCHLIDLCTIDVAPMLASDSIYIRLFAIFNTTLAKGQLAQTVASAMAAYCHQHPECDLKQVMDHTLSICSRTKMSLYMEIESALKNKGMLVFDYRQSFAYEEGLEVGVED
jgi:hypothetical protein